LAFRTAPNVDVACGFGDQGLIAPPLPIFKNPFEILSLQSKKIFENVKKFLSETGFYTYPQIKTPHNFHFINKNEMILNS